MSKTGNGKVKVAKGDVPTDTLAVDIRRLIAEARAGLAATVNSALTLLYWRHRPAHSHRGAQG